MSTLQVNPLKLYIQDIFRAKTTENKYIYELFGLTFKNVMVHGIITNLVSTSDKECVELQLMDCTGTVQIFYDCSKNNHNISKNTFKRLLFDSKTNLQGKFINTDIQKIMMEAVKLKADNLGFEKGDYLAVTGDIFLDECKKTRMICAYECNVTSSERELVWLEELQYSYDNFYFWE